MPHIGYKTLVTENGKLCFAILEIPDDALTNEDRDNVINRGKAKFRCSKATMIDIHDLDGNQIAEAYSQYDKKFKYTIGQTIESEFNSNTNEICAQGIHYFLSPRIYLLNPDKSKYTGTYIGYYESGQIEREVNYVNGKSNGRFVKYYESGQIKYEGNYVDGKCNGISVEYYESGQIWYEENLVDGKRNGRYVEYYESGQIKEEGNYLDGKRNGRSVSYYKSGTIIYANYIGGRVVT